MDILFVGNMKLVSSRFFNVFAKEHSCAVIQRAGTSINVGKNVKVYETHNKKEFENLMVANPYDAIVFFAYNLDNSRDINMEFEHLQDILSVATRYDTKMFFYLRSNEPENVQDGNVLELRTRNIVDNACEELCAAFQKSSGMITRIIRLPYVYSLEFAANKINMLMEAAIQGHEIVFRAGPQREIDAICDEDLGTFLMRVLDEPLDDEIRTINLGGGNHMTYENLAGLYSKLVKGLRVSWIKSDEKTFFSYQEDKSVQEDFGWRPFHRLDNDMPDIYEATIAGAQKSVAEQRAKKRQKIRNIFASLKYPLDIFVIMGFAEILTRVAPDRSYFSSWDIRLVAVLLLGMMDGVTVGLFGAAVAAIFYILNIATNQNLLVFLKEPGTLIPIVFYVLVGNISGYLCDRKNDDIDNACKEAEELDEQYTFLSKLYDKTRETRESFKNQILGFRNSYGRIYALLNRIEGADENNMFAEAVAGTEEIMDSKSIAIYTRIGNGENYTEQSRSMMSKRTVAETINLKDFPDMYDVLKDGKTFINKEMKEGYPSFATGIRTGDEMNGIIMLTNADYNQMTMEYADKFSVVTGIISVDLVRAMRQHAELESQLKEAKLMPAEDFTKLYTAYSDPDGNIQENHTLLHVLVENMTVKEAVRRVSTIIRGDDVVGSDENNRVLLLLPNTSGKGVEIVQQKLKTAGVETKVLRRISQ